MPGIVGIITRGAPDVAQSLLQRMVGTLLHEPGYAHGTFCDTRLGVYAGWVAHPSTSAESLGRAESEDGVRVLLSGEPFRADESDEPTALADDYRRGGADFVRSLDGSFGGLVVDGKRERVILFNDRYGGERIYYHATHDAFYFASEAKALLEVLPQLRAFDEDGVAQYLAFGATLPDSTLFAGVRTLPLASLWTFHGTHVPEKSAYFRPEVWEALGELPDAEYRSRLSETFRKIVLRQFARAPSVGVSITGGLDTRMIMACLPSEKPATVCYTFAGVDGETLDVRIGRKVAEVCGLEHHALRIGACFLEQYGAFVERSAFITDGAVGALGAHEIYFNALARRMAAVRVTGNFGSEILRAMTTFKPLRLASWLLTPEWRERVQACEQRLAAARTKHPVAFAAFHEIPSVHYGIPAAARSQLPVRMPFLSNDIVELAVRSSERERSSAAACSDLIARYSPALAAIPTDRGVVPAAGGRRRLWDAVLAEVTFKLDYMHKEGLPPALGRLEPALSLLSKVGMLGLHKYLPYRGWFQREAHAYARAVMQDPETLAMPWWDEQALSRVLEDHRTGRSNNLREINAVLSLTAVRRRLLGSTLSAPDVTV
jgi:asparagine synthase (glutamine-hydrolysing)